MGFHVSLGECNSQEVVALATSSALSLPQSFSPIFLLGLLESSGLWLARDEEMDPYNSP